MPNQKDIKKLAEMAGLLLGQAHILHEEILEIMSRTNNQVVAPLQVETPYHPTIKTLLENRKNHGQTDV